MSVKLYRSRTDKMIAGVCGGLGEYLRIDPTIIRLFFLLLGLSSGVGVPVYLVLWIIIPYPEQGVVGAGDTLRSGASEIGQRTQGMADDLREAFQRPNPQAGIIVGAALVIFGLVVLLRNLDLPWLLWLRFDLLWPVLLIIGGAVLIWRRLGSDHS